MNKVIRGKRYNTETAKLVGTWEANEPENSDFWEKEELYQKRSGEFFLIGQGGAQTKASRALNSVRSSRKKRLTGPRNISRPMSTKHFSDRLPRTAAVAALL